jgi:hypothetical protein
MSTETAFPREDLFRAIYPGVEVRDVSDGGPVLYGHFTKFGEWTEINSEFEGRFMERSAPGAYTESFKRMTPKVTLNHGNDPSLGDQILGVPTVLREDDEGPYYEVPTFDGIPPLVMSGLRAGAYGASYRFHVEDEEVVRNPERSEHNPEGIPERTITRARVPEFGPVTFPAFAGATAAIRSLTDKFRPHDFDDELAQMVKDHPSDLAALIQRSLEPKPEAKPPKAAPTTPNRFRTREEFLQWM